jgi:hypothetical protein
MLPNKFNRPQKVFAIICLFFVLSSSATAAGVQTITNGNSLLLSCQRALLALDQGLDSLAEDEQNDTFLCMAYLGGLMGAAEHANRLAKLRFSVATDGKGSQQNFNLYCFDWQLPYQKIARIVLEYGRKQPQFGQRPAQELAMRALQTTFPCR